MPRSKRAVKVRSNYRKIWLLSLGLLGLLALPWLPLLTVAVSILLLSSVARFTNGFIGRVFVFLLIYGAMGALLYELPSLFHVSLPFWVAHALLLAMSFGYAYFNHDRISYATSITDICSLGVTVATFLFLIWPLLGASNSKTLQYLLPGEDNNSHFQMYRYALENQHYAYWNDADHPGIRPSLRSYAQGSHMAMAVMTAPLASGKAPLEQLRVYAFSAAATYAFTFGSVFLAAVQGIAVSMRKKLLYPTVTVVAGYYVIFVPLNLFLSLYEYGFYPQYFAYWGIASIALLGLSFQTKPKVGSWELVFVSILFYAVFSSWYLMAPVALILLAAYVLPHWRSLEHWKSVVVLVPVAVACSLLAYVYLFTSPDGSGHVLTPGGVEHLSARILAYVLPGLLFLPTVVKIGKRRSMLVGLLCGLVTIVLIDSVVALYQRQQIQHVEYYFYKLLFSVLLLSVLFYGYLLCLGLSRLLKKSYVFAGGVWYGFGVLLFVLVVGYVNLSLPQKLVAFHQQKYALQEKDDKRVLEVFTNRDVYQKYSDIVGLDSCSSYTNFTQTIWAGGFFLPYDKSRAKLEGSTLARPRDVVANGYINRIIGYAAPKHLPVAVIVSRECSPVDEYRALFKNKNVQMVTQQGVPL